MKLLPSTLARAARCLLLAGLALAALPSAAAQEPIPGDFGRVTGTESTAGPYYFFTERGAPTVRVELWGAVAQPGLYDLRAGTDLRTLLSIAGGPTFEFIPTQRQRIDIVITRGPDGARERLEVLDIEAATLNDNPLLQDGDTVLVRSKSRVAFSYREVITLVASVLGIILAVDRLTQS